MKLKELLFKLLFMTIKNLAQPVKFKLCEVLMEWKAEATETITPVDDVLIQALISLIGCESKPE